MHLKLTVIYMLIIKFQFIINTDLVLIGKVSAETSCGESQCLGDPGGHVRHQGGLQERPEPRETQN